MKSAARYFCRPLLPGYVNPKPFRGITAIQCNRAFRQAVKRISLKKLIQQRYESVIKTASKRSSKADAQKRSSSGSFKRGRDPERAGLSLSFGLLW